MTFIGHAEVLSNGNWVYVCPTCKTNLFPDKEFEADLIDGNGDVLTCAFCQGDIK